MRKLKLIFACLLTAILSIGQVWGQAAAGTTLFSEDFSSYSANNVPSGSVTTATGRVIYGGGSVTYTSADNGSNKTMIYAANLAGGTSPELLVGKSAGVFTIADIPSGGAQVITVSFKQNAQKLTVSVSGDGYSTDYASPKPSAAGTVSFDITVADGAASTFTLSMAAGSSNVRVDDILVTVKTAGEGAAPVTPTCATPTFDPEDGETFTDDIDVEISSETTGATIYYTTDGTNPTTSSSVYSTALNFTETTTLKALAVKADYNNSAITTATYTKVEPFDGSILEIVKGDFNTTSYDANNGDHEKDGITFTTNKVYQSGSSIQFQKTNGLLYNKTDLGNIAKIEITTYTGKANNLEVYAGTTENPSTTQVTGSASGSVTTYTFASGNGFFAIKCNSTGASNVDPIKVYYVYTAPTVATPTISGATPFATSTTITLGCATDGASIYYTTDGTNPSSSSTLYSTPFELNSGATVKAIAIVGSDQSTIASKEFTKVTSYTSLASIFAKAEEVGSTATDIYVTFDSWKISAKNSNNAFLTDGTNGAVIYGSSHGFNAGDVLTGTVACKVQLYKGFAELTTLGSGTAGLTVTPGSVGDPVVKTWDQLSAVNTGALVKLQNLTYDGSSLSDGVNTIPTFTTFYTASFEAGKSYNLTGVYQYYDTDGQILPRSAADVEEIIETFTVTYNNAPDNGTLTIKNSSDEVITSGSAVNEGTVLTIVTSPAEGYKLAGVTVNGSAYSESTLTLSEDVTIAASFEENLSPVITSYVLSVIGVETDMKAGQRVGDKVNLPSSATECSKTFVGWDPASDCSSAPTYAPGAEYTLAENNKLYAVYADANVVAPTDHALGSVTTGGSSGNTPSEGYTFSKSTKGDNKTGYIQDSGTKDETIIFIQIKAESQIINEEPSAIIVTAHLGAGADRDELTYPVNAVLVDAGGNNVGDPVVLTNSIPDKNGEDFSANLPTANYANVRGVKISHMKEDGWNIRYYSMSFKYQTGGTTYDNYSTDCQAQVATPTFSPAAGTYTEAQNVTIASETTGATIYYTTDGTAPSTSSTPYEGAITVGENMTIKAIAVKSGMVNSEIATAEYTINIPVVLTDYYEKVTSTAGIEEGTYLIVYETGSVAFDGGLEALDAASNTIEVEITSDHKIGVASATEAATFYIIPTDGTIQSASGKYIGVSSNSNGLKQSDNADAYENAFAIDGDGNAVISAVFESSTMTLRYNTDAGQNRFRYYKTTSSPAVQLYKLANEVIKPAAGLAWDPAEDITLTVGDAFSAPALLNPNSIDAAEITIASSNEAVATVTNGVVELVAEATGTTTITASFAGNASYKPATVSYKIKVNPANSIYVSSLKVNFGSVAKDATIENQKVTVTLTNVAAATAALSGSGASAFSIDKAALTESGDITISASSATAGEFSATLTISDDAGLAASKVVNLSLTVVDGATEEMAISTTSKWVPATEIVDGMQVLITGVASEVVYAMGEQKSTNRVAYVATLNEGVLTPGEGTMAFTLVAQGDGTYAIRTSNGKYLYAAASGSNHLKTQDEVDVNAKWTLTIESAVAEGSSNRNIMRFNNGSSKLFSCYASGQQPIKFYVPKPAEPVENWVEVRTGLTAGNYYTICLPKKVTAFRGASVWNLEKRNSAETEVYLEEAELPFEAGTPFIIHATAAALEVVYEGEATSTPVPSGALRGTLVDLDTDAFDALPGNIYILKENAIRPRMLGENFLSANRAYIDYDELDEVSSAPLPAPGKRVRAVPMQTNVATGIDALNASETPVKIMIDGQLFILRGENMFDATGRLVK